MPQLRMTAKEFRERGGRGLVDTANLLPVQKKRPLKLKDEGRGLRVTLPLPPSVNDCYRNVAGKGRVLTKKAREYKSQASDMVFAEALCSKFKIAQGARLSLSLLLHFGDYRKHDLDNVCKLINDSIASAMGFDDSAIDCLLLRRGEVDKLNPRCEVALTVL